jgi:hypothetical protein
MLADKYRDRDLAKWRCKRYRVTSIHRVLGHEPGTEFDASLTDQQEFSLLDSGALEIVEEYMQPGVTPGTATVTAKAGERVTPRPPRREPRKRS